MSTTPLEILRSGLTSMHGLLNQAVGDMTLEQLNYRPAEGGLSPFFSLWHYVRTEDNIVNFIAQSRPTVWLEGGYDQRFGLHRTSQGTGMPEEEAKAMLLNDLEGWREYQPAVWQATDDYLAEMSPDEFDTRTVTIKPLGEMSLWQGLNGVCLSHGYRHAGEIEYARGILGLGGLTI
ncbi:MAG: DinB family protein [Chloroflexi bacterium]|nr:DinB family protein [Chloroflexota bacterium]